MEVSFRDIYFCLQAFCFLYYFSEIKRYSVEWTMGPVGMLVGLSALETL